MINYLLFESWHLKVVIEEFLLLYCVEYMNYYNIINNNMGKLSPYINLIVIIRKNEQI